MEKVTGYVTGVNGNLVSARFSGSVRKNEVGFVKIGNDRLKGEVIRISGDAVSMQIYEMTNGIQVGDEVELNGELLSVELGPGLLTQVYLCRSLPSNAASSSSAAYTLTPSPIRNGSSPPASSPATPCSRATRSAACRRGSSRASSWRPSTSRTRAGA